MFLDRSRRVGRHLEWKVRLFSLAAALAVAGIGLDERWMTGAALVLLLGGLGLRFLPDPDLPEGPSDAGVDEAD